MAIRKVARLGHPIDRGWMPEARGPERPAAPRDSSRLRDLPVLIVDDNPTNRRILEAMLKHWQMQPSLAEGGESGLAAMRLAKERGKAFPLVREETKKLRIQ